jgi:uncharacterized protein (DUF433 family)/DNA-binding transcriptional MerR regulator
MNAAPSQRLFGVGLYPLPEAARLAQIDPQTARRWVEGNRFVSRGAPRRSAGVVKPALPRGEDGSRVLTFPELLTLRLVRAFRRHGLALPTIKRVAEKAARDFHVGNPFVHRRFLTDGRKIFVELSEVRPNNDEPSLPPKEVELVEILTGQKQFAEVVRPSLYDNVEWDEDIASAWWPLGRSGGVLLDPRVGFGEPCIARTGIPTSVLAAEVAAEGGGDDAVAAVAEWHGVKPDDVRNAMRFESEWRRRAA